MNNIDDAARLNDIAGRHHWITGEDAISALSTAGEGNMNRVQRAHLSSGRTLIFKESLPYVARYPDIEAPIERIEVEAAFYEAISGHSLATHTPQIIGFDSQAHCLCMEDLGTGSDLTTIYSARPPHTLKLFDHLLTWLSELHGLDIARPGQFANRAMRALNHTHIFDLPFQSDNGLTFSAELTEGWQHLCTQDLIDTAQRLGQIYMDDEPAHGCLLHGDFYPGSWLVNERHGVAIIDPEFAFYGPPEFDVGVLKAHLAFAGYDSAEIHALMRKYRETDIFSHTLADQFAGVEILRRLFGVAQLPLIQSDREKLALATTARDLVLQ